MVAAIQFNSSKVLSKEWQIIDSIRNAKKGVRVMIYDLHIKEWKPGITIDDYYEMGAFVEVSFLDQMNKKRMVFVEEHLAVLLDKD